MRLHNPPGKLSDLRSEMISKAGVWVRQAIELEVAGDKPLRGQATSRATILRSCGIQLRDLADKYAHYVEDAPHDGLMVTICDQAQAVSPASVYIPERFRADFLEFIDGCGEKQ